MRAPLRERRGVWTTAWLGGITSTVLTARCVRAGSEASQLGRRAASLQHVAGGTQRARDAADKSRGGGLHTPDGLPDTMSKQTASLRRVFFDREPIVEAIDFSRYFEGQHIWLSHEKQAEIDRIHRDAGMPEEKGG